MTAADRGRLWAVVPAAGQGIRFGGDGPKQYQALAGRAAIEWSVRALLAVDEIAAVMVALAPGDDEWQRLAIAADPRVRACTGGRERSDSVQAALSALAAEGAADRDGVLVHDAARPGVSPLAVRRLIGAVGDDGGLLAVPVADTLKRSAADTSIGTADRNGLWAAQTPQLFAFGALRDALRAASAAGRAITDEARAMEQAGFRPRLVPGEPGNIKLTRPEDRELLEAILYHRRQGEGR